jgi:hypothetical protein
MASPSASDNVTERKVKQSRSKQSKAKQSKAKQSKVKQSNLFQSLSLHLCLRVQHDVSMLQR